MKPLRLNPHRAYRLQTLLLALATGLLSFGLFLFRNGGFFTLVDDFNAQQIPFTYAVSQALDARPLGGWFWNIDLGTSLVGTFGFYNLGSPFFWLCCLLPLDAIPYALGWLYVLKYVVAAYTAYLYLERFAKAKPAAIAGALLYAFSGFQAINLQFFHFHDVVALFPLLLLGVELAAESKAFRPFFILTVFLNCLVNYFFFVGEVVFLLLYFLFRFRDLPLRARVLMLLKRLSDGAIGVGMAAVLFLPSILCVLGNTRSRPSISLESLIYGARQLLHVLKGMLLPADRMKEAAAVIRNNWKSTGCYLPLFGLSFALAYLRGSRGRKDRLSGLLILCFLVSLSPLLQSAFTLFTDVYQRWWYMFVLLLTLATVKVLDAPEAYPVRSSVLGTLLVTAGFWLCIRFVPFSADAAPLVFDKKQFLIQGLLAVVPAAVLLLLTLSKRRRWLPLLALTALCCALTTAFTLYRLGDGFDAARYRERFAVGAQLTGLDPQYRFAASDDETDDSVLLLSREAAQSCGFCSTLEPSSYAFDRLFDMNYPNRTSHRREIEGLEALLGAKYRLNEGVGDGPVIQTIQAGNAVYTVTEQDACPIGFAADRYLTESELLQLPVQRRAIALMSAIVVRDADEPAVSGLAERYAPEDELALSDAIAQATARAVQDFRRDATGFSCKTDETQDCFVRFSVPYDRGWSASIDGVRTDILYSGGMTAIRVPQGAHTVVFRYHTPGLKAGAILSAVSFGAFAVLFFLCRRKRRA